MNEGDYRLFGKALTYIGAIVFLIPVSAIFIGILNPYRIYYPSPTAITNLTGIILLGIALTGSGAIVLRIHKEGPTFLTKGGEPIHLAEVWKKGTEAGLYLTLCGRVVSVNQTSQGTAHVGYRIATAESATCRECGIKDGLVILDSIGKQREG